MRAAAELSREMLAGSVPVAGEDALAGADESQPIESPQEACERFVVALVGLDGDMPVVRRYASKPSQIPSQ